MRHGSGRCGRDRAALAQRPCGRRAGRRKASSRWWWGRHGRNPRGFRSWHPGPGKRSDSGASRSAAKLTLKAVDRPDPALPHLRRKPPRRRAGAYYAPRLFSAATRRIVRRPATACPAWWTATGRGIDASCSCWSGPATPRSRFLRSFATSPDPGCFRSPSRPPGRFHALFRHACPAWWAGLYRFEEGPISTSGGWRQPRGATLVEQGGSSGSTSRPVALAAPTTRPLAYDVPLDRRRRGRRRAARLPGRGPTHRGPGPNRSPGSWRGSRPWATGVREGRLRRIALVGAGCRRRRNWPSRSNGGLRREAQAAGTKPGLARGLPRLRRSNDPAGLADGDREDASVGSCGPATSRC